MTERSSITIEMSNLYGQPLPTSWVITPYTSSNEEVVGQAELTERIAADLAAGRFSIKVTHVTETERTIR